MRLKEYIQSLPNAAAKQAFAAACGTTLGHLRNCIYEPKPPAEKLCVAIWRQSGGLVTRQELRADWADIWPELDTCASNGAVFKQAA